MKKSSTYRHIVEWDVATWSRAVLFWEHFVEKHNPEMRCGLEIGSRHGGLSYFFAKQYGARMYCSDYGFPSEKARQLHQEQGVGHLVTYHDVDATCIPFETGTFDFVAFKSVLGVVGARGRFDRIELAMREIHRVLKPGGVLFFAENLRGSMLHRAGRALFVPWGRSWYYLTLAELHALLDIFPNNQVHATGLGAVFVPEPEWLRGLVSQADAVFSFLPDGWKYVGYGVGRKD